MIEIVATGLATTIQDGGRPGFADIGVPISGAVDRELAALVNRIVGNPVGAATFETCGGLTIEAVAPVVVAASTAPAPTALRPGQRFTVSGGGGRLWHYLAVRGGIDAPPALGSRSSDTLSGIGPPPPATGDRYRLAGGAVEPILVDVAPPRPVADVARLTPGPRADWFAPDTLEVIAATAWTVTTSSRVGVRLHGARLVRVVDAELPSEGLVRGAIQVPPDGDPVMMLADHPTTGGYPVIAVVHPDDVAIVAQHPAGAGIRLRV